VKKYLVVLFALGILDSETVLGQLPVVKISPAETYIELSEVGELFVRVENISGFRAYSIKLSYDAQKLRCLSVTRATFFSNWNTFFFSLVDSNSSLITVDEAILGLGHENGSGDLFKVQFLALAEGDVNIDFLSADLRDTLNNLIEVQIENGIVHITNPTSVEDIKAVESINKITAYPNPFNSSTKIEYLSDNNEETELAVYSITGEKVFSLEVNSKNSARVSFVWNGKDMDGNILPSGIYLLTAKSKNDVNTLKLISLK
jgi:Secretion system C-terminal sorting domain/Cohesin domain